jgi:hypothetical protein
MNLGLSAWDLLERLAVVLRRLLYQYRRLVWSCPFLQTENQKEDPPALLYWLDFVVNLG